MEISFKFNNSVLCRVNICFQDSITKSVIQEKLEKVKAKKEMMEQAEIEKVQSG